MIKKMDTNVGKNEFHEQAFLAGIALERCKRSQSEEEVLDTTDPISAEPTGSQFASAERETCDILYDFMMKKKVPYNIPSIRGWTIGLTLEGYFETLHDSSVQVAFSPKVCILPTPPSHPLLYLVNVPDDIKEHLMKAVSLVNKHFSDIQTMDVNWEQGPETGEEWIVIETTIKNEIDHVLDQYDKYTDEWVLSAPWPAREKVRISYNII